MTSRSTVLCRSTILISPARSVGASGLARRLGRAVPHRLGRGRGQYFACRVGELAACRGGQPRTELFGRCCVDLVVARRDLIVAGAISSSRGAISSSRGAISSSRWRDLVVARRDLVVASDLVVARHSSHRREARSHRREARSRWLWQRRGPLSQLRARRPAASAASAVQRLGSRRRGGLQRASCALRLAITDARTPLGVLGALRRT